jgi:hypothetical protein
MKRVLIFCFLQLSIFSLVAIIYQCATGEELSPTLVQWFYTVFGVELAASALLKIAEIRKEKKKNQTEEPPEESYEGDESL